MPRGIYKRKKAKKGTDPAWTDEARAKRAATKSSRLHLVSKPSVGNRERRELIFMIKLLVARL